MATATLITIPIYQINSAAVNRTLYPYGNPMAFGGASIMVQPNTSDGTLNSLQAGRLAGGALIYSAVSTSVQPGTVFWSSLTVAAIVSLANA